MKILNLYAGVGGNRQLWGDEHEVTAVEFDEEIAGVYAQQFPADEVVVTDALGFLAERFTEFDFIWSSPPCPTHGQYRFNVGERAKGYDPVIPEMTSLYGTIVFLEHRFSGLYAVENTVPYYQPLIEPTVKLQRHLVWSNFDVEPMRLAAKGVRSKNKIGDYADLGVDLSGTRIKNKRQVLRNMADPVMGRHVLDAAERAYSARKGGG